MNNQSSCTAQQQNSDALASLFGPELYPVIAGFQHLNSRHPHIDVEAIAIFLDLMRKGDLTMLKAEAVASTESLAFLKNVQLINVAEVEDASAIALTGIGRELAAELLAIFETKASPLQS